MLGEAFVYVIIRPNVYRYCWVYIETLRAHKRLRGSLAQAARKT